MNVLLFMLLCYVGDVCCWKLMLLIVGVVVLYVGVVVVVVV